MAGLGSACSHLAALLFKLQACVQLELNKEAVCTSKLCTWNRARTKVEPAPLKSINFKRPRKDSKTPSLPNPPKKTLKDFTTRDSAPISEEDKNDLKSLYEIAPNAAVFTCVNWIHEISDDNDTDSADENDSTSLPEPLSFLYDPSVISMSQN